MDDDISLERGVRPDLAVRAGSDPAVVRYRFRLRAPDGREFTSGVLAVRVPAPPTKPDEPPRAEPVGPAPVSPAPEKIAIEAQLLTAQGEPAPNKRFRLVLAGGKNIEGHSDAEGRIKAHADTAGDYTLILPDFESKGGSDG